MNFVSRTRSGPQWLPQALLLLALLALAGCKREEIRVYTAPKDKPPPSQSMAARPRPAVRPQLEWTLPPGWRQRQVDPEQMTLASFSIGDTEQEANVNITQMPLLKGREAMIVNMWRNQVGMEALSEAEAEKQFQPVEVGGESGSLFEVTGTSQGKPMRIVTVMVHRADASWFYKLQGDAALADAQKPVFLKFLKSIRIKESTPQPTEGTTKFNFRAPSQWKALPAGEMQVARFAVPERAGAKAEVFVSVFNSDTGGNLANINRWREQLGLGAINDSELATIASPLDPSNPGALLVDMTNNNSRLIAAIVPRDGSFWFYKMFGDGAAVTPERDAFVAFVKATP